MGWLYIVRVILDKLSSTVVWLDKFFILCYNQSTMALATYLLRGVPFSLKGPVTRSSPVSSCFRTTTLFPLCTPARRMATVPADREERTVLLC